VEKISIKIDGKELSVEQGKTILEVALENGINIPSLCYHPDVETKNHCEMCLIEIKGEDGLKRACTTQIRQGMKIITESPEIKKSRNKKLDLILKKHLLECDDCVWFQHCQLLELVNKLKGKITNEKPEGTEVFQSGSIVFDQTKCIGCEHCIGVCPTDFLEMNDRGQIVLSEDKAKDCINCGQCIIHCPVGAIEGVGEFEQLEKFFKDKNKVTVVQFAPSLRTSIGEEFGLEYGEIATGQLVAGLKKLGFDYVFDTASGADFTTMEEAEELVGRITKNEKLPAMSSCCPAWVKFIEFYYPEFIENLCTSRSPQTILGGIIKNYWSKENKIRRDDIFMVSIMPCVAKKFEIKRKELKIDGVYPVDSVLTTRELVRIFKQNKIDLKKIDSIEADDPLGQPSGAGVIYGSSGGVFESALRTAYFKMTGKELPRNAIKEIRGMDGIKRKEVKIGDRVIKVCVVNGIKNARKIMDELKSNPKKYDAIEVMACPGGCVGGGGQSMPTNKEVIKRRGESLYVIDEQKEIKSAHQNPAVKKIYAEFFSNLKIRKKILHTHFDPRKKTKIEELRNSRECKAI